MREYIDYLKDIRDEIHQALAFVSGVSYEEFLENAMLNHAVVRSLEVVGEAAKGIPEDVRQQYPEVPWRRMAGMRDVLIHHYFGVDLEIVWRTATEILPDLAPQVERVLSELKS